GLTPLPSSITLAPAAGEAGLNMSLWFGAGISSVAQSAGQGSGAFTYASRGLDIPHPADHTPAVPMITARNILGCSFCVMPHRLAQVARDVAPMGDGIAP